MTNVQWIERGGAVKDKNQIVEFCAQMESVLPSGCVTWQSRELVDARHWHQMWTGTFFQL